MSPKKPSSHSSRNTTSRYTAISGSTDESGVSKSGARITAIRTLSGQTFAGQMFIDASYEGDLLATAGVEYHVGRESREQYNEQWNGVQTGVLHHRHHFEAVSLPISPYVVADDPASGLLPRVSSDPPGDYGSADKRIQAYCFRMCLTNDPRNRVPFPKPQGYDPGQYELLLRVLQAGCASASTNSIRSPITRPIPITMVRSAPTISASTTTTPKDRTSVGERSSTSTSSINRG